ncbi:hypothetical protein SDC9_144961 [bioreactor metagenome]|uniref:Uncharacterized protein n=1 Tax=bioreactor metagenome TaxID=1076179 RepID=A0A645E7D4_9ZZZZ
MQQQKRERQLTPHGLRADDYDDDYHGFCNRNHDVVQHFIDTGSIEACRLDHFNGNRCIVGGHDIGAEWPEVSHPNKDQARVIVDQVQFPANLEYLDRKQHLWENHQE